MYTLIKVYRLVLFKYQLHLNKLLKSKYMYLWLLIYFNSWYKKQSTKLQLWNLGHHFPSNQTFMYLQQGFIIWDVSDSQRADVPKKASISPLYNKGKSLGVYILILGYGELYPQSQHKLLTVTPSVLWNENTHSKVSGFARYGHFMLGYNQNASVTHLPSITVYYIL